MSETLNFTIEDGVGWIVLNRPEARNAMNAEMREAYLAALARCAEDAEIRAVVLTATGKGFCTGADLSGSRAATGAAGPRASRRDPRGDATEPARHPCAVGPREADRWRASTASPPDSARTSRTPATW